jgi:Raf kinase inhibitor-like YbhB/YbcL family protein
MTITATIAVLLVVSVTHASAFELKSSAFPRNGAIPRTYSCNGPDRSPPLGWTNPPAGAKSYALVVEDPDAPGGTWVHWVLYKIPLSTRQLSEGVPRRDTVAGTGSQGMNDFKKVGWGGPCPPPGPAHRYVFTLYALDAEPSLPAGKTRADLDAAIEGHVLAQAELVGRFQSQAGR